MAKSRARTVVISFAAGMVIGLGVLTVLDLLSTNAPVKGTVATRILINKAERTCYLYNGTEEIGRFRIGLGSAPQGDKIRSGDRRTPEGKYYVCVKNPNSKYYLSVGLSYPNTSDAERGLETGLIDDRQYAAISDAIDAGKAPPWDTDLGGEIFIHGHGAARDWTLGCVAMDDADMKLLYDAVSLGTPVEIVAGQRQEQQTAAAEEHEQPTDLFALARTNGESTVRIQSSVDGGPWQTLQAICPLKGQVVRLKVDKTAGSSIRWFRICPDTSKIYKNANFPWDENPYQWIGLARIDYLREELDQFRDHWEIEPFAGSHMRTAGKQRHCRTDVGSFWFQAEVVRDGVINRSPGIEDSDERGLSPKVFRVSIRESEGYLGYVTSFFNVPGLFGSVTYQSNNYIGVDCADVLMAAHGRFKNKLMDKNYNVAMAVDRFKKAAGCEIAGGSPDKKLTWSGDIKPGDLIAVKYRGARQYQHIGALYSDKDEDGVLSADDLIIHAGPDPLHISPLANGNFDGEVAILRP